MSRTLRGPLLGCIAIAYVYLFAHAREPLRLDVGDPSADASALISIHTAQAVDEVNNPPCSRLVLGALEEVVGGDVGRLRPVSLIFAVLASWLLFSYVSRLYDQRVALVATTFFSTSLLWMAHADSVHQAPLMQCMAFLALWGTVRAIETGQLRHYVAVGVGSFACLFTAYDYYLVLPVAVLATIHIKKGPPRIAAICAAGALVAIVATCLLGHVPRIAQSYNRELVSTLPAIARRATLGLTPFLWVTVGFHLIRAIRASTPAEAVKDGVTWMFVAAAVWFVWFSPRAASRLIGLQVFLPFYVIGSSLLVTRLLDGGPRLRKLAVAWLVAAPLWSFYWMFTQPRAWLDRDDVAEAKAYLAANDANDFVLSNLLDDAPLEAALGRHAFEVLDARVATEAPRQMMRTFEMTGSDAVHAIIFTDPGSRLDEQALSVLATPRRLWSVLGWPQVTLHKSSALIREYDQKVLANLTALRATKVLQLRHFAIYRIERAATLAAIAESVPSTARIDFDTVDAAPHELLGWDPLRESYDSPAGATLRGLSRCRDKHCKTARGEHGMVVPAAERVQVGQLMVRLEEPCDLVLTATFSEPSEVRFAANGFTTPPSRGNPVTVTIPGSSLTRGVNVIELENLGRGASLRVSSIDLASACEAR